MQQPPPQGGYAPQPYPPQQYPPQGYPQGYPQYPYPPQQYQYPPQGYPPQQYPPQQDYSQGYPPQQGYPQYPPQGYPPQGYPPQQGGYPPQEQHQPPQGGYPQQPYPPQGGGGAPQSGGHPPPQQGGYPPQGVGGAPPQQQQSGASWATFPPIDSFADWTWDNNGRSWSDVPHQAHHYKLGSGANPRYCVSTAWEILACWNCTVDVYDLENEALVAHLSCQKPEYSYMHDAEPWGDIVFSVGAEGGAIARVYSISSTEQTGYWKGLAEQGLYNCTVVETPTPTGVGASFNGAEVRLFDINTCKPSGKLAGAYDGYPSYLFSNPVERNTFYIADSGGKIHQYDTRAKKKQRTLLAQPDGWKGQISFSPTAGGKIVVSHSSRISIIDSNTGKLLHTGSGSGDNHFAVLEKNMMVVGAGNKIWFFDTNKFTEKDIDFSQAEYDMASQQWIHGMGYGQGKIHVISSNGWKTLSNPSVKQ